MGQNEHQPLQPQLQSSLFRKTARAHRLWVTMQSSQKPTAPSSRDKLTPSRYSANGHASLPVRAQSCVIGCSVYMRGMSVVLRCPRISSSCAKNASYATSWGGVHGNCAVARKHSERRKKRRVHGILYRVACKIDLLVEMLRASATLQPRSPPKSSDVAADASL